MRKYRQLKEKGPSLFHFYNIDHRKTILVCMCRSTSPLFTTAMLPNIWIIWLPGKAFVVSCHCATPKYYYIILIKKYTFLNN